MEEILGFHPWGPRESPTGHGGQQAIIESLWRDRFVKVDSCNNAGKSYLAAFIVTTFLQTIENSMVISTAPGAPQLENVWRPIRSAWGRAREPLMGRVLNDRIEIAPKWYARGLVSDTEERYQGPHFEQSIDWGLGETEETIKVDDDYGAILVVVDEHGGFEDRKAFFWNALLGYLAQRNVYVLLIGNPNVAEGVPYRITKTGEWVEKWTCHRIGAADVPRAVMEPGFEEKMLRTYGEDHSQYKIRVLGEYVDSTTDQLFPRYLLDKCKNLQNPLQGDGKHIGVDVARQGGDSTVATLTVEGVVKAVEVWGDADLTLHAEHIATLAREWGVPPENIHIDIGMGAGVADRLREAGLEVDLVDWGAVPEGDWPAECAETKFPGSGGRKMEMHWVARQLLHQGRVCIPEKFEQTWQQLGWIKAAWDDNQLFKVEKKDKLKTRTGGVSPDFADSWILSLSRAGTGWGVY